MQEENPAQLRVLPACIAALLYVICPVDLMPAIPLDDIAAVVLAIRCVIRNAG